MVEMGSLEVLLPEDKLVAVEIGVHDYLCVAWGGSIVVLFEFVVAVFAASLVVQDAGVKVFDSDLLCDDAGELHGPF